MPNSALIKNIIHNAVAEGIYKEIISRSARYYHYLGKTLSWEDELNPELPTDSILYENECRNKIITLKELKFSDVAFVIPRVNWESGTIYDQYDDSYSDQVIGINLINEGTGYITAPYVYIGSEGSVNWTASTSTAVGSLLKSGNRYYVVTVPGTTGTTAPTHTTGIAANGGTTLKYVSVSDGGGEGATASSAVFDGKITHITLTHRGSGYTSAPSIIIAGPNGEDAEAESVVAIAASGVQTIEEANMYVLTEDDRIYKCLSNNYGSTSTVRPSLTIAEPFQTSDGYKWKYICSIPVALKNKFLTNVYMPVANALQDQFYADGKLQSFIINKPGSGYTTANIAIQGNGHLESDPIYISSANIISGGEDYTSPTLEADYPFLNVVNFPGTDTASLTGVRYAYNNNVYEVVISGTTDSDSPPEHTYGTVSSGTAGLKYIGTRITGTATETDGVITSITLDALLKSIYVVSAGSGYTSTPAITISGGGGSGATAIATMRGGSIAYITITDIGSDFVSEPQVTIGTEWEASTAYTLGQQIFYSSNLYTVTTAGTSSSTAPTHTTGSQSNGTATLQYAGSAASASATLKYGAGYSTAPEITISGGSGTGANIAVSHVKSEALVYPIIDNGQIIGVQVSEGGTGYTYAKVTVTGDGAGASIDADVNVGNIDSLQASNELLVVDGAIDNIMVMSGGYGYSSSPTVVVEGDGENLSAQAVVVGGVITKINITNRGSGYRYCNVMISDTTGTGATARAIIGPFGGHGKNVLNELYARTLMFYSNVSLDQNQGFDVNNDYRQVGIIKSPMVFGSKELYTQTIGSTCWVLSGTIDTALFTKDALITNQDGKTFRIVSNTNSAVLVQSLDNLEPSIGDVLSNSDGDSFTITGKTSPTIDKYSGDLLFIDNRQAFTPSDEQVVTLRTVIRF